MANGGARPGAGRPPGSKNKLHIEYRKKLLEKYPLQPLEYWMKILNTPTKETISVPKTVNGKVQMKNGDVVYQHRLMNPNGHTHPFKMEAAKNAAPYLHAKIETITLIAEDGSGSRKFSINEKNLSDDQLATLAHLLELAQYNDRDTDEGSEVKLAPDGSEATPAPKKPRSLPRVAVKR
jgi:hypothetical protein